MKLEEGGRKIPVNRLQNLDFACTGEGLAMALTAW
jgi:hypothetical protein